MLERFLKVLAKTTDGKHTQPDRKDHQQHCSDPELRHTQGNHERDPDGLIERPGASKDASHSDASFVWVDDFQFLTESVDLRSRTFGTVPLAVPPAFADIMTLRSDKALDEGMVYRSTLNTARDVLAWDKSRPAEEERVAGLTSAQEQDLLQKWHTKE